MNNDTVSIDWDQVYVRLIAFLAANKQVQSVAPDQAISLHAEVSLSACVEIITCHQHQLIDLNAPYFESTAHHLFDEIASIGNAYDVDLLVTDA